MLWVLAALLLLVVLLFVLPVSLRVDYNDSLRLSVGAIGIFIPIVPKKKKKIRLSSFSLKKHKKRLEKERKKERLKKEKAALKAKNKAEANKAKKKNKDKKLPAAEVDDGPSVLRILLGMVGEILDTFFGKLRVKLTTVRITVGGSDATKTALTYGIVAQSVAYLTELISQKTRRLPSCKDDISVEANFLSEKTTACICIVFQLRLVDLISTGIRIAIRFMKKKSESS